MRDSNIYRSALNNLVPGHTKLPGQSFPFVSNSGEINASSNADLIAQIGAALQTGNTTQVKATPQELAERKAERLQVLIDANNDKSGESMQVLGEAMAAEIYETTNREGFARRVLQFNEIGQGEMNEVKLKEKNIIAFMAVSPSEVAANEIRERKFYPAEFHLNGYILIDTGELSKSSGDLLEEKYDEGLEAIMVQEDRLWKTMAEKTVGIRNNLQSFATFTPTIFARMLNQVSRWGIPATTCLFSSSLWQDIIANGEFTGVLDPVTQWELLQDGFLGSMYGVSMLTDNFRQANLKVLNDGELYIVGAPINHGVLTVRGSLTSEPINKFAMGEPKKGWFLDQLLSMVLGNPSSVSKGQKI